MTRHESRYIFTYAKSYLARKDAVSLYDPELPLQPGIIEPEFVMAGALRDASPDGWGRRVIASALLGQQGDEIRTNAIDELTYLLESGSNRIGALDFQVSSSVYTPRQHPTATLQDLQLAAEQIEEGRDLHPDLHNALRMGSAIGGARPKALITDHGRELIAKFANRQDGGGRALKAEYIAMRLASLVGIDAAKVELTSVAGKDVLLVERFDRVIKNGTMQRLGLVSALTILNGDEGNMDSFSYADDLAEAIRIRFKNPRATLHEMFRRMVFNVISGNSDDHAKNHAAFWDGSELILTPAFDIAPPMIKRTADQPDSQAMYILGRDRRSNLALCRRAAGAFHLDEAAAREMITHQIATVKDQLPKLCREVKFTPTEQSVLESVMLHPTIFQKWDEVS